MVSKPRCQLTVRMRKMDVAMVSDVYWYGDGVLVIDCAMAVVVRKRWWLCPGDVTEFSLMTKMPLSYIHRRICTSSPLQRRNHNLSSPSPPLSALHASVLRRRFWSRSPSFVD
ncbi:hypothetical protein QVD17_37906 [Tagetes erecta]|uniref:Uncharacterized protein n=1 Tax=Tagetes erecta TaxID=13708 RepID=A0AAD8JWV0_TARER|nr:hypothetical protein QVD17_37906 [Tagetes erecta]